MRTRGRNFKLFTSGDLGDQIRDKWRSRLLSSLPDLLHRPSRLGRGKWMTVATLGEFRVVDDRGILDMKRTAEVLCDAAREVHRVVEGAP